MHLLAVDIGGFTQDILFFDSTQPIENCFKMIMPSPTTILAKKIRAATKAQKPIFFFGVNMGSGPSKKALIEHLHAGNKAYATVESAATFDDNIDEIAKLGVTIIGDDEKPAADNLEIIETKDLDLAKIEATLRTFDFESCFDGIAVAVLDHGAAPPGISDRVFRFQHLKQLMSNKRDLTTWAYLSHEIPPHLTRMKAIVQSAERDIPFLLMDTPVAAAIGSLEDRNVSCHDHKIIINVGNFHTLAFHLQDNTIIGFFEHHTHSLTTDKMDQLITKLVDGRLTNEEIFRDGGHGCLIMENRKTLPFISVTGPQRSLMATSKLRPYFAAPHGDMMLSGCFGLVRAFAQKIDGWKEEIEKSLSGH